MYIVYMHTCPNGKKYIGITGQSAERRWQKGKGYAYGSNDYFYNAIKKYGWENIQHDILFNNLTKEEAEEKEKMLISKYNTTDRNFGYNIDNGGSSFGKHSEEYKKRMSNMQKEIWKNSPERKEKMSKMRTGIHLSEETKEKIRQANLGKKYSEDVIKKRIAKTKGKKRPEISKRMKELWQSGHFKGNTGSKGTLKQKEAARKNAKIAQEYVKKPILQFDKQGNFLAEFSSSVEAMRKLNLPNAHISAVCNGKRKTTCGFIFKFKEE